MMGESIRDFHLEITKEDKMYVRELAKIHLGLNLSVEEDCEAVPIVTNLSARAQNPCLKSQIKFLKKKVIEDVIRQFLNKKTKSVGDLTSVKPDSNMKSINLCESTPDKTVNKYQTDASSIDSTLNDESETSLVTNEDYDAMSGECEEICEPGGRKSEDHVQQSTSDLTVSSPVNGASYQSDAQNNSPLRTNNDSYNAPGLSPSPTGSMVELIAKYPVLSDLQRKLTKGELNPTACLYELCGKLKWPNPEFLQIYHEHANAYSFEVSVDNVTFQGKWAATQKSAKHLAAADCLKYLGFKFPKELGETELSDPKKGGSSVMRTNNNGFKQKTKNKPISTSSKGNIDLRTKLDIKRGLRKKLLESINKK